MSLILNISTPAKYFGFNFHYYNYANNYNIALTLMDKIHHDILSPSNINKIK